MKGRDKLYEGGYLMDRKLVKTDSFHSLLFVVSVIVTAALLSKSRKTLQRPVRFSGFKSVRILCFAVNFCELYYPLYCRLPLHYLLLN